MVRFATSLHSGVPRREMRSASALLGHEHPLARTLEALTAVAWQSLVVAAVMAASLVAAAGDVAWAPPAAASAGVVLLALGVAAALLRQRRLEQVLALIAAGGEDLPLALIERERGRLLDRRTRWRLAAGLESLVEEANNASPVAARPLFDRAVVKAVADELIGVAELLRAAPSSARGIALVWFLIWDGVESSLHRGDVAELQEELGRIRYLLSERIVGRGERAAAAANRASVVQGGDGNRRRG